MPDKCAMEPPRKGLRQRDWQRMLTEVRESIGFVWAANERGSPQLTPQRPRSRIKYPFRVSSWQSSNQSTSFVRGATCYGSNSPCRLFHSDFSLRQPFLPKVAGSSAGCVSAADSPGQRSCQRQRSQVELAESLRSRFQAPRYSMKGDVKRKNFSSELGHANFSLLCSIS